MQLVILNVTGGGVKDLLYLPCESARLPFSQSVCPVDMLSTQLFRLKKAAQNGCKARHNNCEKGSGAQSVLTPPISDVPH
jgi:hypothetical protein